MNRSMKIYTLIFILSLGFAYYASTGEENKGKSIEWFNLGTNKIESLTLESSSKEVKIYKKDIPLSDKARKALKSSRNASSFEVSYLDKTKKDAKGEVNQEPIVLRGNYAVSGYLDNYCPLRISRVINSDDLESFGLSENSDKIIIQAGDLTKTLWVGEERHDSYFRYYYDTETKKMFLAGTELYGSLQRANQEFVQYSLTDVTEADFSTLEFSDLLRKTEPKTIYKVLTEKQSMGWSASKNSQEDPKLSRFVQFLMGIPVVKSVSESIEPELNYEIHLIQDGRTIEVIKIAKIKEEFFGQSNFSGGWLKLDERSVGFLTDLVTEI